MFLASPIWLVLVAPWAALVVWLLRGRLETTGVPFLELWGKETAQKQRSRREWKMPPMAMIALLGAMLLAIMAAAGPMIRQNELPVSSPSSDVRIEKLAVRTGPTTQAMIRIVNESDLTTAKLTVRDGSDVVSENVDLPGRGQTRNYFLDLPSAGAMVDAEIAAGAGTEIDHHLEAERNAAWPVVEGRGTLPAELERMIEVYGRHRMPGEGSKHIAVIADAEDLTADEPAAFVVSPRFGTHAFSSIEPLVVRDSPLTRSVDWQQSLAGAKVESPPLGDWQPIVSAAGAVVVALRQEPFREVWVGFDSEEFGRRADFVIFWSNVFDWLGEGGADYEAAAPASIPSSPAVAAKSAVSLAGQVFLGALGLMVISALSWKAPKFTDGKNFQS